MKKESLDFLKRLMEAPSPSGYEGPAAEIWRAEAKKFSDQVKTDLHGNTIAVLNKGGSPRVMLAGHIDEIGLMIQSIDENGFARFQGVGGWDPQILPGQRVVFIGKKGPVKGIIGKKPVHLMEQGERTKAVKIEELWVDFGTGSKKETEELISIGDVGVIDVGFQIIHGNNAIARGFDDRIGAFVVLEALRLLSKMNISAEVYAVATVQEEIGLRGAHTAAFGIDPKVGIAVDVTFATDYPGMGSKEKDIFGNIKLGGGPVIARGPNINHRVHELLVKTAKEKKIPYVIEAIPRGTGTDANAIQLSRAGVAAGLISVPNRNMHTPVEMVNLEDVEGAFSLLAHAVAKITDKTNLIPF
ncbi:MAG: M42 family metallopeptidase [candidate division WOR-3 bacterium]